MFILMGHISHIAIIDTPNLGINVMGMPRCSMLPLHDHPKMLGFTYLMHGTVNVF
jgi:hypothetical protein